MELCLIDMVYVYAIGLNLKEFADLKSMLLVGSLSEQKWRRSRQFLRVLKIPLWYIINSSIIEGEFPDSWKISKVTPIWKQKGSKKDKTNYRPVSNLKSASKVLEIIVNQQILRYFELNKLLPKSQHGFRPSRSTFTAVASMHEMWLKKS